MIGYRSGTITDVETHTVSAEVLWLAIEWRDRGKEGEKGTDAEDVGGMMMMTTVVVMMMEAPMIAYSLSKQGFRAG